MCVRFCREIDRPNPNRPAFPCGSRIAFSLYLKASGFPALNPKTKIATEDISLEIKQLTRKRVKWVEEALLH